MREAVAIVRIPSEAKIHAPHLPRDLSWANVASLRMDKQKGRPVLLEFWDFCRVNSLRTLPYVKAWHERYSEAGLRVISVHTPGFEPGKDEDAVRAAVERLGITHPVCLDTGWQVWELFGNLGWPARYLFDEQLVLFEQHYGEGGYRETELAIQELLGEEHKRDVVEPVRPEDDPEAEIVAPTQDRLGAYSGPYAAGAVWAVTLGTGTLSVNGRTVAVIDPGVQLLVDHGVHTEGVLQLDAGAGVTVHATCFTAGVVSAAAT